MLKLIEYGGKTSVGYNKTVNEDFIGHKKLSDNILVCILADGMGAGALTIKPSDVVVSHILDSFERLYKFSPEAFKDVNMLKYFINEFTFSANKILLGMKFANDSEYAGFYTTVTGCVIVDNQVHFFHAGNSRLYLLRHNDEQIYTIKQMTIDDTKAQSLVDNEIISENDYYTHPDKATLTNIIGKNDFSLQTYSFKAKDKDIILLTSDGIHNAIKKEAILQIVLNADCWDTACSSLFEGSEVLKYPDNVSSILLRFGDCD